MALRARKVMMMALAAAEAEIVRAVGKIDPVEHFHAQEFLYGPIDRGAPDLRVVPVQPFDEIFCGERRAGPPETYQVPRDDLPRPGAALAELFESRRDPFLDIHFLILAGIASILQSPSLAYLPGYGHPFHGIPPLLLTSRSRSTATISLR